MGRKVRIEFEEVAGYIQMGTEHLWIDEKEVRTPMSFRFKGSKFVKID